MARLLEDGYTLRNTAGVRLRQILERVAVSGPAARAELRDLMEQRGGRFSRRAVAEAIRKGLLRPLLQPAEVWHHERGDMLRVCRIGAELAIGAQLVRARGRPRPSPVEAPVGWGRSPVRSDHRRGRDFDPLTEGRGLRRINRLEAIAATL
jgi:hypothetical protein